jgi:biotin transport system ATP-binding protein
LNIPREETAGAAGRPVLFSARKLSKVFPNGNRALGGLNLEVREGECILIAGSNGSGKTLLMRILAGLAEPSGGELLFRGEPLSPGRLRGEVGLVFQDPEAQILGETVEEDLDFGPRNLGFSKEEVRERRVRALRELGLTEKGDFPPRRLSGGEQRRLAVAGVRAMGCDALIMDEPFANLDWPGVVQVLRIIRDLKAGGRTLIILTHELEKTLAFADRLVILDRGRIRDQGIPEEVLDRLDPAWGVRDPRRAYPSAADCTWLED